MRRSWRRCGARPPARRRPRPSGEATAATANGRRSDRIDLLSERLVDYRATVRRVASLELRAAVEELARGRIGVPPGLPAEWRPADAVEDHGLTAARAGRARRSPDRLHRRDRRDGHARARRRPDRRAARPDARPRPPRLHRPSRAGRRDGAGGVRGVARRCESPADVRVGPVGDVRHRAEAGGRSARPAETRRRASSRTSSSWPSMRL